MNTTDSPTVTAAPERDLLGLVSTAPRDATSTAIMSRTDSTKQLGRRITFDTLTLAEYKAKIAADPSLNSKQKKEARQRFLSAGAIEQRRMLGIAALQASYAPDSFAPMGRVPDTMELRANGTLKLVSVEKFIGKDKAETPAQKVARLERELREAKAAAATPPTLDMETPGEAAAATPPTLDMETPGEAAAATPPTLDMETPGEAAPAPEVASAE